MVSRGSLKVAQGNNTCFAEFQITFWLALPSWFRKLSCFFRLPTYNFVDFQRHLLPRLQKYQRIASWEGMARENKTQINETKRNETEREKLRREIKLQREQIQSGEMDEEDYTKLKRAELQKLCKAYKLKATGKVSIGEKAATATNDWPV